MHVSNFIPDEGKVTANKRGIFSPEQLLALKVARTLLTEGLQYFASQRDPSMRDVGIDMAGAGLGMLLVWVALRLKLLRF